MSKISNEQAAKELRAAAESQLALAAVPELSPTSTDALLHELHVHQIELEMQNEALQQAQVVMEESRDRYVDLYEFAPLGYFTLTRNGMIEAVNLTGALMLGVVRKKLLARRFSYVVAPEDRDRWHRHFIKTLQDDQQQSFDLLLQRNDATRFHAQLDCRHFQADGVSSVRVALTDITERKEAEAERSRLAYYDPLTNLPNRRLLYDRLGQALVGCQRTGHFGALLFLDMDNFKNLNDTRGHDVGDQLLVDAAKRIEANVREGDTVARLGGDEFVVVLEGLSNTAAEAAMQTRQVSEKIRDSITWPYDLSGREFYCTCSIGITMFHDQCESIDILLKQADMAMYKAKDAGRNALRFFDPAMQTTLDDRSEMEEALHWAIQRDQFHLYFQSQIDGERRVVGAEALLRWLHPERGWVSPRDFIPLAEETSLILPIGHWALNAACLQLKAWSVSALTRELWLAVNVSTRQFRQPEFVDDVQKILVETGIDPTRLKLELTESLVIHNVADTISKMMTLKALGIRFSMDDFGTGYSSLSYLKLLPLSQLKIDRSFIAGITSDANDSAIVRTIITMGQVLGLHVIAEGVETEEQLTCLQQFGCQAFQGFLFGEPMALSEFESSLQTAAQSKPESPLPS
ncbi:putative signaling protein [Ferriphaselus amnicola]|uniref:Putative signaling protein n=1 Tax=Ferriphaselus amnicola TaxID=1188319 RepID=A0A2Z6GC14_9PROT|nr:GGDEF and EAL domain-containing protein [Ferriphaselus amnicola]BBE50725.1 putative signaling protein [Ferriphaselus amnicola]